MQLNKSNEFAAIRVESNPIGSREIVAKKKAKIVDAQYFLCAD